MTQRREKPGRKLESGIQAVRRREVSIDEQTETMLKVLGKGNLSRGARHAARVAFAAYQREPDESPGESPATGAP